MWQKFSLAPAFFFLLLGPSFSAQAKPPDNALVQAEERTREAFQKRSREFYENGNLKNTRSIEGQTAYIAKAKEVRSDIYQELLQKDFPPEVAAAAVNKVILNSPIIRDPCFPYPAEQIATGKLDPTIADKANMPKRRPKKPAEEAKETNPPKAQDLVENYICNDGEKVIEGLGVLDPKDFSKGSDTGEKPKVAESPQSPPREALPPEPKPPAPLADANQGSEPRVSEQNLPVRDSGDKAPKPPRGPLAQGPQPSPEAPPRTEVLPPTPEPFFGPTSFSGPSVASGLKESTPAGSNHSGSAGTAMAAEDAEEAPAQAPPRATGSRPSAELAAENWSIAQKALDEKVAAGLLDPKAAATVLNHLKPLLKTEPDLAVALTSVRDTLKAPLSREQIPPRDQSASNSLRKPESLGELAPLSGTPTAKTQPTAASVVPSSSVAGLALPFLAAKNDAALLATGVNEEIAKGISSKLSASNALEPAESKGMKKDLGQSASALLKSANSLNGKPSNGVSLPFSFHKADSPASPQVASAEGATQRSVKEVVSKIADLLSLSSFGDEFKPRAISSTNGKVVSNDRDFATEVGTRGDTVDQGDLNSTNGFLGYRMKALAASAAAFLGGFALWRRHRETRKPRKATRP